MISLFAKFYAYGSILIGFVLIIDSVFLIRRRGAFQARPDGKAVGWSYAFMITEMWWAGTSAYVLLKGYPRPLVALVYLAITVVELVAGFAANRKSGPVLSLPKWRAYSNLAVSIAFVVLAAYEAMKFGSA